MAVQLRGLPWVTSDVTTLPGLPRTTQVRACYPSILIIHPSQKCLGLSNEFYGHPKLRRLCGENGSATKRLFLVIIVGMCGF